MVEATERRCVNGSDPDALFDIPFFGGDFEDAPELEAIGTDLIATVPEFERIQWAMRDEDARISYFWKKKAAKNADRVKAGTLSKSSGLLKHLTESHYYVVIAVDANRGATNWHMEALVYHELRHIKVEVKLLGKGEDAVSVPDLKVRAHDVEMFESEVERYGLWRADLERAKKTFEQAPLFTQGRAKPSRPSKPTDDAYVPSATVLAAAEALHETGATVRMGATEAKRVNLVTATAD